MKLVERRHASGGLLAGLAIAVLVTALLAQRGTGGTPQARAGSLSVTGGYVRQPASTDVAAAYLTVTNSGGTADTLMSVTTAAAQSVSVMSEEPDGTMSDAPTVVVPAHGTVHLTPDHEHLMLATPVAATMQPGQRVTLALTFAHAGRLDVTVPVVAIGATP